VGDRPITSGYRNDARRIDTGGVSICRGRFTCPGDGSDVAGTGLGIGARRDTERLRAKACTRSCGTASRCGSLVTESGPACSRERSRAATSSASTFTLRTLQPLLCGLKSDISRGPRSAKSGPLVIGHTDKAARRLCPTSLLCNVGSSYS